MLAEEQMDLSWEEMFLMFEKNRAPRQFSNHTVEGANLSCFQDRCWCTDNRLFDIHSVMVRNSINDLKGHCPSKKSVIEQLLHNLEVI